MMHAFLCIALFALGHLNRDGFPATGETQLARGIGAAWCMVGASAMLPPLQAVAVGWAIWLGFYTDQKHAEGQRARGWKDAGYLALSGLTSVVPLALVLSTIILSVGMSGPWVGLAFAINLKALALTVAAGLAKVPVYFVAWGTVPERGWLQPTRLAAIIFGAIVGAAVAYLGGV